MSVPSETSQKTSERGASRQQWLSAQLQLMVKLAGPKFSCERCKIKPCYVGGSDAADELRFLDAIALLLTNGKPGDDLVAAFDRHFRGTILVLAKGSIADTGDRCCAEDLVDAIVEAKDAAGILPVVLSYRYIEMQERIDKLHGYIPQFLAVFETAVARSREVPQVEEEIIAESLAQDVPEMRHLSGTYRAHLAALSLQSKITLDPENESSSLQAYMELINSSHALLNSIIQQHVEKSACYDVGEWGKAAYLLKKHLLKVCAYWDGASLVLEHVRTYFPDGKIRHRWVGEVDSGEGVYDISGAYRRLTSGYFKATEISEMLQERGSLGNLDVPFELRVAPHPELRLIIDIDSRAPPSGFDSSGVNPRYIGRCKRACFCCTRWIDAYNDMFNTRWVLPRGYGKIDPTWAPLPLPREYFPNVYDTKYLPECDISWSIAGHLRHLVWQCVPEKKPLNQKDGNNEPGALV